MADVRGPNMDLVDWQNGDPTSLPASAGFSSDDSNGTGTSVPDDASPYLAILSRAIESDVIPRMVRAHRNLDAKQAAVAGTPPWAPSADEIEAFVATTLMADDAPATAFVQALVDRGVQIEVIFEDLFGGAARHLGAMWELDDTSFTSVTTAVWRIQQILRTLSADFMGNRQEAVGGPRILLVRAIGGQHMLGMAMVSEYFRKGGWVVSTALPGTNRELTALVRANWFDVVGFSVGGDEQLTMLTKSISAARRASQNRQMGVMVGGAVFVAQPGLVSNVGADATAADAAQALIEANRLMTLLAQIV